MEDSDGPIEARATLVQAARWIAFQRPPRERRVEQVLSYEPYPEVAPRYSTTGYDGREKVAAWNAWRSAKQALLHALMIGKLEAFAEGESRIPREHWYWKTTDWTHNKIHLPGLWETRDKPIRAAVEHKKIQIKTTDLICAFPAPAEESDEANSQTSRMPPPWRTPFIEFLLEIEAELGPKTHSTPIKQLVETIGKRGRQRFGNDWSDKKSRMAATFLRPVEAAKGGNTRWNRPASAQSKNPLTPLD